MEAKYKELNGSANILLVNIEGGTGPCGAFTTKHGLTLPHFGLKGVSQASLDLCDSLEQQDTLTLHMQRR